nr:D-ala D-ala ligase C-terminus [uncultured bacterium]
MDKLLVLQGGKSSEREVSLRSAATVTQQLHALGYDVVVADPAEADFNLEQVARDCNVVLPMIHGADGEDGVWQKQLEAMDKTFLGSGSAACALTFDKSKYREFVTAQGVRMAAGETVDRAGFTSSGLHQKPYVLKPIDGGSSVDTVIVHQLADEPDEAYFDELFARHPSMLLEELIEGDEITVAVLDTQALPIILIVPPGDETFDYENKYNGRTQEIVDPPQLAEETKQKAQELALRLHRMTGCRHLSRTDMIVNGDGNLYVLETNTLPGLTDQSLFPKAAAAVGYDMRALVKCFVTLAKEV